MVKNPIDKGYVSHFWVTYLILPWMVIPLSNWLVTGLWPTYIWDDPNLRDLTIYTVGVAMIEWE